MEPPPAEKCLQTVENYQILKKRLPNGFFIWIQRGLPLQLSNVRHLAWLLLSAWSKPSKDISISERRVSQFIKCYPELKSRYTRRYDYQRAKCEDPELIKGWFNRVQEVILRYGIAEQDIYNIDETGFQMGVASTAKVVCGCET